MISNSWPVAATGGGADANLQIVGRLQISGSFLILFDGGRRRAAWTYVNLSVFLPPSYGWTCGMAAGGNYAMFKRAARG